MIHDVCYCFKKHKVAQPWRKKAFPLYDDMADLVDGIIATGQSAFRPGIRAPSKPETDVDTPVDVPVASSDFDLKSIDPALRPLAGTSNDGVSSFLAALVLLIA